MSPAKKKARIAFFDFTCCEGCQVEITNFGEPIFMGLLEHAEVVEFREVMTETTAEPIDIALVEGSFTREADRARLEEIRRRARIVIAYGACASIAGINALKNDQPDCAAFVYGADAGGAQLASQTARPISAVIPVDYELHGCPMSRDELVHVLSHLLHGKDPVIPNYPVCVQCKMRETVCRYHLGDYCMGVVARAGCGAPCPADGVPCEACRGYVDHPNLDAMMKVLVEQGGLSAARAAEVPKMFNAYRREEAP